MFLTIYTYICIYLKVHISCTNIQEHILCEDRINVESDKDVSMNKLTKNSAVKYVYIKTKETSLCLNG